MEKNFLKDVIPPAHQKSVRDIPLPKKSGKSSFVRSGDSSMRKASAHVPKRSRRIPEGHFARKKSKTPMIIGSLLVVGIGVWIFGVLTHSATVTITQTPIQSGQIDGSYTIFNQQNPPETVPQTYIPYSLQTITTEASQSVTASGQEEVEQFASGTIKVKKSTPGNQPLIKNTRFQSQDGRIYRVRDSITVPGNGEKEITVYADEPGESYNLASGTFTVPGLKDLPEFDEITAETVTEISGGFQGVRGVVSEEDEERTRAALQEKLEQDLIAQISGSISSDKIFYYTPSFIEYVSSPSEVLGENVLIKERGILQGLLFEKDDVTESLVRAAVSGVDNIEDVAIENIDEISITLEDKEEFDPETAEVGSLLISGNPVFTWGLSEADMSETLMGLGVAEAESNLLQKNGIQGFDINITPFWRNGLPQKSENITVSFE